MMLATILFGVLGIAAVLAAGAMIGTWRNYGAAWAVLDAECARVAAVSVCYVSNRPNGSQPTCALVPAMRVRTVPKGDRPWHGLRAAA